jgi:hypothetical protein
MDAQLKALREYIWPVRPGTRRGASIRDGLAMLIALLFLLIVVGPDLLAYIELSAMLDFLGAALFLFAFAVAIKVLLLSLARRLRSAVAPEDLVLLAAWPSQKSGRAFWVGLVALRAFRVYMPVAVWIAVGGIFLVHAPSRL